MVLGVQHVVHEPRALHELGQRLRRVHAGGADEHRISQLVQASCLLDDGVVLLAPRLEDEIVAVVADDGTIRRDDRDFHEIVAVVADDGTIRRDDRDFQLVDLVELRLFRLGRAGHAGQLLVHAEVVLDGDRGHGLRLALHADPFLGLDRLVQSLAPATTRHGAAGVFIDDQHLAVLHDVVDVLLVQRVRPEKLVHDVETLALGRVVDLELAAGRDLLVARQVRRVIDAVHRLAEIGQHVCLVIVRRHEVDAAVRQMDGMPPFIEDEEQILLDVAVRLLVRRQLPVGEVLQLHLQHELLVALLLHELEEPPVLRVAHLRLVEFDRGVLRIPRAQVTLRIGDELIDHLHLTAHQPRHGGVVLEVLDVPVVADGTRDDERRPRLIDEHGVHFVDDGIDVDTLYALVERDDHVVAQVIEAEFVVGAVRDVREIRGAPLRRPGLGVVDAADGESQVREQMPHPLRIAACQIRVHRDEVRAAPWQCIQVEWQRGDERLALASPHFRDPAKVQLNAAHELNVVRHHVPLLLAARDGHRRAHEPSAGLAHRREGLG